MGKSQVQFGWRGQCVIASWGWGWGVASHPTSLPTLFFAWATALNKLSYISHSLFLWFIVSNKHVLNKFERCTISYKWVDGLGHVTKYAGHGAALPVPLLAGSEVNE